MRRHEVNAAERLLAKGRPPLPDLEERALHHVDESAIERAGVPEGTRLDPVLSVEPEELLDATMSHPVLGRSAPMLPYLSGHGAGCRDVFAARIPAFEQVIGVNEARAIVCRRLTTAAWSASWTGSGLTRAPSFVLDAPPMGKFDRRNSQKMKRRKAQVKKKTRLKALRTSPAAPAKAPKKAAAKKSAPPKSQAEPKV